MFTCKRILTALTSLNEKKEYFNIWMIFADRRKIVFNFVSFFFFVFCSLFQFAHFAYCLSLVLSNIPIRNTELMKKNRKAKCCCTLNIFQFFFFSFIRHIRIQLIFNWMNRRDGPVCIHGVRSWEQCFFFDNSTCYQMTEKKKKQFNNSSLTRYAPLCALVHKNVLNGCGRPPFDQFH